MTTENVDRTPSEPANTIPTAVPREADEVAMAEAAAAAERTQSGLPKRGGRQAPISIVRAPSVADAASAGEGDSRAAAARMGAFQQGTQSGRQPVPAQHEGSDRQ